MNKDTVIKKQLLFLIRGGNAHTPVKRILKNFPLSLRNKKLPNVSYTPWQLLEHLRIAQEDIYDFITDKNYTSPEWPDGFWPEKDKFVDEEKWHNSVELFFESLDKIEKLIKNEKLDFFAAIPHAETYTIFREILVLADHNSYHLGQLSLIQKMGI